MTALIKTVIAALLGVLGSLGNAEMDGTTIDVNRVKESKINSSCSIYTSFTCYQNSEKS